MREAGKAVSDPEHVCSTPPVLNRQMHRLTKIGKEHVFYKKNSSNRQNVITDFNLIKSISFKI